MVYAIEYVRPTGITSSYIDDTTSHATPYWLLQSPSIVVDTESSDFPTEQMIPLTLCRAGQVTTMCGNGLRWLINKKTVPDWYSLFLFHIVQV